MRIISAGLMGGVLLFLAITLFVRPAMIENAASQLDLVSYLAVAGAVLSLPIASVLRAARWPATTPDQDPKYWAKRGAAHIVSMALLEGPAFFCCIALLVSKPVWPLFALLVPMSGMVAWFPRDE